MSKIQTEAIQIYIGIFLWTLSFPVLLPTLIFLSCWKCVVLLYIKIRYFKATPNPLLVPTNVSDTMYSITELTNTISYAFIGDGMIDIDKLRTHFYNTFIEDGKDEQVIPKVHHLNFVTKYIPVIKQPILNILVPLVPPNRYHNPRFLLQNPGSPRPKQTNSRRGIPSWTRN